MILSKIDRCRSMYVVFQVTNRYINQLKEGFPNHQWTLDYIAHEKAFERVAAEAKV